MCAREGWDHQETVGVTALKSIRGRQLGRDGNHPLLEIRMFQDVNEVVAIILREIVVIPPLDVNRSTCQRREAPLILASHLFRGGSPHLSDE